MSISHIFILSTLALFIMVIMINITITIIKTKMADTIKAAAAEINNQMNRMGVAVISAEFVKQHLSKEQPVYLVTKIDSLSDINIEGTMVVIHDRVITTNQDVL